MRLGRVIATTLFVLLLGCSLVSPENERVAAAAGRESERSMNHVVVGIYVETPGQLANVCRLIESLQAFGGAWRDAPVWVYKPEDVSIEDGALLAKLSSLGGEIRPSRTPAAAKWFFYGGKPFGAAAAEEAAAGRAELLVWLDDDTIFLQEPREFDLAPGVCLAYCPVMHNRSGTLHGAAPNPFWARIYAKLALTDEMLFPMVTPADEQEIRAYFHCGELVVRPERGILRGWAQDFEALCGDSVLVALCKADRNNRVFLHQTALTGAILHRLAPEEMVQLSSRYNYPIFFERQYGAAKRFDSVEDAATIRIVVSAQAMGPTWAAELAGPADRIAWLKEHLR